MGREEWSMDGVVGGVERGDWWVDGMVCRVGWRGVV